MISLEKWLILTQKLPKNVGDLGKLIVAKGFKKLPKVQKLSNLVTLSRSHIYLRWITAHNSHMFGSERCCGLESLGGDKSESLENVEMMALNSMWLPALNGGVTFVIEINPFSTLRCRSRSSIHCLFPELKSRGNLNGITVFPLKLIYGSNLHTTAAALR